MSGVLERLLNNKDSSEAKSYIVGLERGRIWAEDYADYFELREWSEVQVNGSDFILPDGEDEHFNRMSTKSPLESDAYLRGWVEGVKEIRQKY